MENDSQTMKDLHNIIWGEHPLITSLIKVLKAGGPTIITTHNILSHAPTRCLPRLACLRLN